ncbi:MAG: efflux RND transporter periplasmic adaptor subunit [Kiritimatiellia bacterium]
MKTFIFFFIFLVAAGGGGGWYAWRKWGRQEKAATYRTVKVERGEVLQIVRATGIVQPVKLVQVGTQVNGIVQKLYVDFNSRVKAGDVVARIDPSVYQANLSQGEANLARNQAAVDEARAGLLKATNDLARATGLASKQLISNADLDSAIASAASASAQLKVAIAQVQQTAAALDLARANLSYTVITAPVDGIVIARNVDEGQTVVTSMSAQTLLTIATDLRTVLISASVPEADIGPVSPGQKVTFNVDAYPTAFTGTVDQIRLAASTVQNVVTYPVMVRAENPGEKLFPGMTANISCVIAERTNVLRVANAALRFKPENADAAGKSGKSGKSDKPPAVAGNSGTPPRSGRSGEKKPKLYVQQPDGSLTPLRITTGITDGTFTEVSGDDLSEGQEVVAGLLNNGAKSAVVNPFMPTPPTPQTRPPRM